MAIGCAAASARSTRKERYELIHVHHTWRRAWAPHGHWNGRLAHAAAAIARAQSNDTHIAHPHPPQRRAFACPLLRRVAQPRPLTKRRRVATRYDSTCPHHNTQGPAWREQCAADSELGNAFEAAIGPCHGPSALLPGLGSLPASHQITFFSRLLTTTWPHHRRAARRVHGRHASALLCSALPASPFSASPRSLVSATAPAPPKHTYSTAPQGFVASVLNPYGQLTRRRVLGRVSVDAGLCSAVALDYIHSLSTHQDIYKYPYMNEEAFAARLRLRVVFLCPAHKNVKS